MSNMVRRAALEAKFWHGEQLRKYTERPYWTHCSEVANLVSSVGGTDEMISAAWLHDTLEDTKCTAEHLLKMFNRTVVGYVWQLTDPVGQPGINRAKRKELDRERLERACIEVKTIKLADLIDNSHSIRKYDPAFAKTYLAEKRLLVSGPLLDGDARLWKRADDILRAAGH